MKHQLHLALNIIFMIFKDFLDITFIKKIFKKSEMNNYKL